MSRTVEVRLTAKTEQYQKAMGEAQSATSKLESEGGRSMSKLGASMQSAGRTATVGVTLPLVGVGAASIKMASNFDASMSKIVGLVGLSADEVDGMKASVLELAGSTATAPQELSDALFVLTSAGLKGDEALSALEYSAKASAAGLGETNDIARAVSGAMNAYGPGVLDAAHATDVLTATARAGNFETSELASSLGKVLPFAKQAQASFEDVGGAVALLTRTNGNASESVTQIQALMRAFVVPTAEAATALTAVGLSAEDVRDSIGENGLVSTLQMLDGKLGGNREQLGRLLGSSEAASAAFQILDADAQTIADTFGVTNNAVGLTQSAFEAFSSTASGEMKQALVDLGIAMIQIGEVLAPMAADLAGGVSKLAGAFSDLDPFLQKVVIGIAGAAAAAGPLLIVAGSMIKNFTLLKGSVTAADGSINNFGKTAVIAAQAMAAMAAIDLAFTVFNSITDSSGKATRALEATTIAAGEFADTGKGAADVMAEFAQTARAADEAMTFGHLFTDFGAKIKVFGDDAKRPIEDIDKAFDQLMAKGPQAAQVVLDAWRETASGYDETSGQYKDNIELIDRYQERVDLSKGSTDALSGALSENADAADDQATATGKATAATEDATDATEDATAAMGGQAGAAKIIQREIDLAASNLRRFGSDGVENMGAVEDATGAAEDVVSAITEAFARLRNEMSDRSAWLDVEDAIDAHEDALVAAAAAQEEFGAGSREAADANREVERTMMGRRQSVIDYLEEVEDVPPEKITEIKALLNRGDLIAAEAEIERLARARQTRVDIVTYYSSVGSSSTPVQPNRGGARAHGGATYGGYMHEVNENGSELLTEGGKTYLMAARDGFVTPLSTAGGSSNITGDTHNYNTTVENNRRDLTPEDMARTLRLARFAA